MFSVPKVPNHERVASFMVAMFLGGIIITDHFLIGTTYDFNSALLA